MVNVSLIDAILREQDNPGSSTTRKIRDLYNTRSGEEAIVQHSEEDHEFQSILLQALKTIPMADNGEDDQPISYTVKLKDSDEKRPATLSSITISKPFSPLFLNNMKKFGVSSDWLAKRSNSLRQASYSRSSLKSNTNQLDAMIKSASTKPIKSNRKLSFIETPAKIETNKENADPLVETAEQSNETSKPATAPTPYDLSSDIDEDEDVSPNSKEFSLRIPRVNLPAEGEKRLASSSSSSSDDDSKEEKTPKTKKKVTIVSDDETPATKKTEGSPSLSSDDHSKEEKASKTKKKRTIKKKAIVSDNESPALDQTGGSPSLSSDDNSKQEEPKETFANDDDIPTTNQTKEPSSDDDLKQEKATTKKKKRTSKKKAIINDDDTPTIAEKEGSPSVSSDEDMKEEKVSKPTKKKRASQKETTVNDAETPTTVETKKSAQKKSKADLEQSRIEHLKKLLRISGIKLIIKKTDLEQLPSDKARIAYLKAFFDAAGFTGNITIKDCEKYRKKRDTEKELSEIQASAVNVRGHVKGGRTLRGQARTPERPDVSVKRKRSGSSEVDENGSSSDDDKPTTKKRRILTMEASPEVSEEE